VELEIVGVLRRRRLLFLRFVVESEVAKDVV
jgi:hypothetical protein